MSETCVPAASDHTYRELLRTMFADLRHDMLSALKSAGASSKELSDAETYLFRLPDLYLRQMAELPDGHWSDICDQAFKAMSSVSYLTGDLSGWVLPEFPPRSGALLRERAAELRERLDEVYRAARERSSEPVPVTVH